MSEDKYLSIQAQLHLARIPHNIRDGVPLFLLLSNLCVGTEDFG